MDRSGSRLPERDDQLGSDKKQTWTSSRRIRVAENRLYPLIGSHRDPPAADMPSHRFMCEKCQKQKSEGVREPGRTVRPSPGRSWLPLQFSSTEYRP